MMLSNCFFLIFIIYLAIIINKKPANAIQQTLLVRSQATNPLIFVIFVITPKESYQMLCRPQLKYLFSLSANFAILGLPSSCSFETAKKKYYELAKLYHPDVNSTPNAQAKFTQITQAYKYIADNYDSAERRFHNTSQQTEKKQEKQQYGNASGFKNDKRQKTRMEQNEYEDFQEYDAYFKNSKKFRKPKVGEDIYLNISISLKESVSGVGKEVAYSRYEPCQQCTSKPYSACFSCGGKAEIYDRVNRQKVRCEACSGRGFRNDCSGCLGAGYIVKEVKEKVYAQKGTQDKTILKMEYKGHSGYKADNGHLYITILVDQDPLFRVDGNNVYSHLDLDFLTATFGGSIRVDTLHGEREVEIAPGTQSGTELRLFNAGLQSPFSKRMGDQIMKVRIKIPQKLSEKQRRLLGRLNQLQSL